MTRRDFQRLADIRAREAAALVRSRNYQGAYYLGGFAVECALKACIAKKTRRYDFPDKIHTARVHTHSLLELLRVSDLNARLELDMRTNPRLAANWGVVKVWSVDSRYQADRLNGRDMVTAVSSLPDGVLEWIKQHW
jgi:HEPN domain-containing protein